MSRPKAQGTRARTASGRLLAYGFKAATSTDCFYIFRAGAAYIYLIYWVDDMLLISNSDKERLKFEKAITDPKSGFNVTCEGLASWFLGCRITQRPTKAPRGREVEL